VIVFLRSPLLALVVLCCACDRLPSPPVELARHPAVHVADVGTANSDVLQHLRVGDVLRVHLRASPASGDRWTFASPLPSVLCMESDPGAVPFDDARQGAMQTWTFRAERRGHARLRFVRRRPFASSPESDLDYEFFVAIQ